LNRTETKCNLKFEIQFRN